MAYLDGPAADLAFRRGWTHGVLALALLPFLLAGAMVAVDRVWRRFGRAALPSAASPRDLLLLAGVSILSHPILDTLNTYGVRWLMPFDGRWFYGDVLFIVDPWLWLALGGGVLLSRPRRGLGRGVEPGPTRPARLALGFLVAYATAMAVGGLAARRVAARELAEWRGRAVDRLMLSPRPISPLERRVVAAQGDAYVVGRFRWLASPRVERSSLRSYPRARPGHPAVAAAAGTTEGRRFLGWARFPTWRIDSLGAREYLVHIVDLRYADGPGASFAAASIPVHLP
jgi:inner membrane protein